MENALSVLRQVLALAVDDKRLPRNPCDGVKPPRRQHRPRGYLTHDQVEQLACAVGEYGTLVRLLAYTELRWGEMAALRVEAMDMLRRRVHVREAVAEVGGKVVWSSPKTHERRSVPFPAFLGEELASSMVGKPRDALVFTAPSGGVLRVSTWRPRVFARAVDSIRAAVAAQRQKEIAATGDAVTAEFPTITPNDLRHTAASLAISAGANPKAVQTMLGHQSAVLTMDTYADLFPDDLELVAAALDGARRTALESAADVLRTGMQKSPDRSDRSRL